MEVYHLILSNLKAFFKNAFCPFSAEPIHDALTHDRPYRFASEHKLAVEYIIENFRVLFDPEVVNKFKILINKDSSSFIY